ncbi:hypothetical protein OHB12_04895 [Nocardia sp. NBC_01730]|uniref:hypothetical protein n=1 Tax=Nocardia sp. NBC_01730 TaxID=2975998 RepID=UPI002E167FA8|nr:hypothetical protein OHB12_04895 [Nocardia sp. NBC_01730]
MNTRIRAYGIARSDVSGDSVDADVDAMRQLAEERSFDLRAIRVEDCDADFGLLLATLGPSRITALLVPSVLHLTGWLDAARYDAAVWSVDPLGYWPRLRAPGASAAFVPVGSL